MLDLRAQISLITTAVVEELQLKGKSIIVMITKVGGQEEELNTKMY